ncbi:lysozyme [Shigella dysenteriae]|nr:lysozyme [Shigella dysenteriae]
MNTKIKYGLSAAVLALIAAGAPAPEILDQFLDEKEGNHTTAYRDGAGIWTICRGAILVDSKPVVPCVKPPAPPAWIMQPAPNWQTPLHGIISPSESG